MTASGTGSGADRVLYSGWGNTAPSSAEPRDPAGAEQLASTLRDLPARGVIARGLGRSYGDAAQNAGGAVVNTTGVSGITDLDLAAGTATVLAGTSLHDLMRWLVPLGWFVPVTPGTRQVTVGGAIASDIHGKNHHRRGSWCNAVLSITLATPAAGVRIVSPERDPDLFWATAGGMGLTGIIIDATIRLEPIETSRIAVDTERTEDLDEVLDLMESGDHEYDYSVAWIDLMAKGRRMGRSILTRGHFARLDQLDRRSRRDPLSFNSGTLATAPPIFPSGLLNPVTVKAFNEVWYRKAPRRRRGSIQTISEFFHPLDLVDRWDRIYGPRGFLQWQGVVPLAATDDLRWIVDQLSASGRTSFLAVLKRFGPGNEGHLSFPMEGWTITLDIPVDAPETLRPLLDRLDERLVEVGGRGYFAKDSRMRAELVGAMYPRLDEWRAVVESVDPDRVLVSDLARRLRLRG